MIYIYISYDLRIRSNQHHENTPEKTGVSMTFPPFRSSEVSIRRKGGKGEKTVFLFSDSQILGCIF